MDVPAKLAEIQVQKAAIVERFNALQQELQQVQTQAVELQGAEKALNELLGNEPAPQ